MCFKKKQRNYFLLKPMGLAKVTIFLASRKIYLSGLHVMESDLVETDTLSKAIFCNGWFNEHMRWWSDALWELKDLEPPKNYNLEGAPEVEDITCSKLLENLEDPRQRSTPIAKCRGKICETMVDNMKTNSHTDSEMLREFIAEIGDTVDPILSRVIEENPFRLMSKHL